MDKTNFEQDILYVLNKHGYKTEGIKNLYLKWNSNELPEIEINYFII